MTERERWIVYPLLFLALGAALRDKLFNQTNTKKILCQELVVTSEDVAGQEGAVLVRVGAVPRTSADSPHVGQITVNGVIQAQAVQAEDINADNYYFRSVPVPAMFKAMLGLSPAEWLQALQRQAAAAGNLPKQKGSNDNSEDQNDDGAGKPAEGSPSQPPQLVPPAK
jgi:hypothetical protein